MRISWGGLVWELEWEGIGMNRGRDRDTKRCGMEGKQS